MKLSKNFQNKEKVESIRYIFSVTYQSLKKAILICSRGMIGSSLCSLSITDLVLSIIERVDVGFTTSTRPIIDNTKSRLQHNEDHTIAREAAILNASNSPASASGEMASIFFVPMSKDGILLSADSVFPMLKACLNEFNFRGVELDTSAGIARVQHPGSEGKCTDLIDYASVLLKNENHLLASRVLLSSWMHFPRKSQVFKMNTFPLK
jgi:hypothetical protein